jgi:GNAT superfamily N-acetyltransferase
MKSNQTIDQFEIKKSNLKEVDLLVKAHAKSLVFPMDSWLEDQLFSSAVYKLMYGTKCVGYAAQKKQTLQFFHVRKKYFRYAPALLEKVVAENSIERVFVITQDALLCALIAEWEFEKEKHACFFTDSGQAANPGVNITNAIFRIAGINDISKIRRGTGEYYNEKSGGFSSLEERIAAGAIFILEDKHNLLGCGNIEKGRVCLDCASVGMFVNQDFRGKGYAPVILIKLKEWCYSNGFIPVAGCWYPNTLSRKSLEAAGMVATSIGFEAILKGKEKLPLRTGNPPGELVKEKK